MATFLKSVVLLFIYLYQKGISPIKPPACRFYPTCSQYFYDAVQRYGALKGLLLGFKRLLRCHPFNPGGYNPVE